MKTVMCDHGMWEIEASIGADMLCPLCLHAQVEALTQDAAAFDRIKGLLARDRDSAIRQRDEARAALREAIERAESWLRLHWREERDEATCESGVKEDIVRWRRALGEAL